ncbi:MAG: alpha/beta fold hydrolase [Elusimicrobiaceae bacterium]|nr:alpha/beta fold hydrolase [Elusimicrobiaceae bacterium]
MTVIIILVALFICAFCIKLYRALNWHQPPLKVYPKDMGFEAEDIAFKNQDDITLKGWFLPCAGSSKTLVLMHGFEMDKSQILPQTINLAKKYNLFYFDFRGMGESSGKSAQGLREYLDAQAALEYLRKNKPEKCKEIALYGISLGASVAAYIAAIDKTIKAVILEACFYSYKRVVRKWAWNHHTLPYYPIVYIFLRFKRFKFHTGLEDLSPKTSAPLIACPVLQIHGKNDRLVSYKRALRVFDAIKCTKELWLVEEAGHTRCHEVAGAKYLQEISKFLEKYFK